MVRGYNFHPALRLAGCLFILLLLTTAASALIMVGRGNAPVSDNNWPAGALEVANLKTRVGWWEGPPFGGGQHQFLYRGDAAAFQQAIDLFAKIRSPELRLVIHEGPQENQFLKDERDPKADTRVDWTFTVWNAQSWHQLYNNSASTFSANAPGGGFRSPVDPPCIDVYVAGADGKGIDFKQIKVPAGITVTDERATAAGYPADAGSVVRGDVYDMSTSKPIANAEVVVARHDNQGKTEQVAGKADGQGHFELKNIPPGSYRVSVSADGYAPRMLGYVQLGSNALKQYTTHLVPPAKVRGTVIDTDGKPVAGVEVIASSIIAIDGRGYLLPDRPEATTDDKGAFELAGLPQGFLQLHGHHKTYFMLDILKPYAAPADDIVLRVTATGSVKGRVLRPDGKPAADANVSVNPPGERIGKWGGSTQVSPDGTFHFDGVPPGKYFVSANPGLAITGNDPAAKEIEVKTGQTVEVELTGR